MRHATTEMWALRWDRAGKPGGFVVNNGALPRLFRTWRDARDYANEIFGYLRTKPAPRRVTVLVSDYGEG